MKFAASLTTSAFVVMATLSQANPVPDLGSSPITKPFCNAIAIEIRSEFNAQDFKDSYYKDSTIMVSALQYDQKLFLDSVDFASSTCRVVNCNKDAGLSKRSTVHVDSPKGSDCILPKATVSTFKCNGDKKGEVVLTIDANNKASFVATNAVAYFGSWYANECVTAARKGKSVSTSGKDFLVVDCSDKFESACTAA